jgi:pyruvate-ferredoxin/flavodoxin oxidoreductase
MPVGRYMYTENRFKMLSRSRPEEAKRVLQQAQTDVTDRCKLYEHLAAIKEPFNPGHG